MSDQRQRVIKELHERAETYRHGLTKSECKRSPQEWLLFLMENLGDLTVVIQGQRLGYDRTDALRETAWLAAFVEAAYADLATRTDW